MLEKARVVKPMQMVLCSTASGAKIFNTVRASTQILTAKPMIQSTSMGKSKAATDTASKFSVMVLLTGVSLRTGFAMVKDSCPALTVPRTGVSTRMANSMAKDS